MYAFAWLILYKVGGKACCCAHTQATDTIKYSHAWWDPLQHVKSFACPHPWKCNNCPVYRSTSLLNIYVLF